MLKGGEEGTHPMPASLTCAYICSCRWHWQEKAALSKVASTNSPYPALPGAKPAVLCALNPPGCVGGWSLPGSVITSSALPYGLATRMEGQVSAKDTQLGSPFLKHTHILNLYIYFWLCWVFVAAPAFSSCGWRGLLYCGAHLPVAVASHGGTQAPGHEGFCSCSRRAQWLWHTGFVALRHVESSWTRN